MWLPSARSEAQAHIGLPVCGAPWWVLLQHCITLHYVSLASVVSRAFSTLCTYSKFGHHPHHLGYLYANFVSFVAPIAELAHGETSHTHSITHPAYLMAEKLNCLHFGTITNQTPCMNTDSAVINAKMKWCWILLLKEQYMTWPKYTRREHLAGCG